MAADAGESLHAVFRSQEDARDALNRLTQDGVPADNIEIRSSVPLVPGILPAKDKLASRVFRNASIGGSLGGAAFVLMVKFTSEAYVLPTGGMPIVPLPPAAIISFEGVAIGAILSTVISVLYECGLPSRTRRGPLDHHLADDCVLVTVRCSEEASTAWTAKAIEMMRA